MLSLRSDLIKLKKKTDIALRFIIFEHSHKTKLKWTLQFFASMIFKAYQNLSVFELLLIDLTNLQNISLLFSKVQMVSVALGQIENFG